MRGGELALRNVLLDVDFDLLRGDLVRTRPRIRLDDLERRHRLELECTRAELLEVVERGD